MSNPTNNGRPAGWSVPLAGRAQKALSRFIGPAAIHPNGKTIALAVKTTTEA